MSLHISKMACFCVSDSAEDLVGEIIFLNVLVENGSEGIETVVRENVGKSLGRGLIAARIAKRAGQLASHTLSDNKIGEKMNRHHKVQMAKLGLIHDDVNSIKNIIVHFGVNKYISECETFFQKMTNGSDAFNKKYILNNSGRNFLPSFKERRKRFNLSSNNFRACWNELEKLRGETLETLISMQNLVGTIMSTLMGMMQDAT